MANFTGSEERDEFPNLFGRNPFTHCKHVRDGLLSSLRCGELLRQARAYDARRYHVGKNALFGERASNRLRCRMDRRF